ncbi:MULTISPECIES: HD domain-containing phosphohydrolase [unclassified Methylophaga]|jgi:HD-GYP domain-containing protein (c-di-GMP phosphodiesterase class II)/ABC-type amino acid transport substrate-binding protein|uniref:HD domain-containing phosphohydrolase n=2 Tax=Methylophaga TaxID=40222 RepID=UPI000C8ABBB5|nr:MULTISPECIES: HD domain-containing phosphohydrolase [unclassified Methylophaga]MAK68012.1 phosphohydrolase [Methylophaga sp.]MAY16787.1 phosphohydrolase [Methylophaga sp.]HAO23718.1 phosphohydrolase [Methylophaga sp.]|tara:strand:+ start:6499 stop:9654 length:3156 start_codon:yes stop_codon:yes gene_type:complete
MEKRNKKFQLSIRTAVVAGLILFSLLVAVASITVQYYFNKNAAESSITKRYQQTLKSIHEYLDSIDTRAKNEINELAQLPAIAENPRMSGDTRQVLMAVMQRNQLFQSVYIGQQSGDVEQLINLQSSPDLRPHLRAEEADRWLLIKIFNQGEQQQRRLEYYDRNFTLRHVWQHNSDIDINHHPWFSDAKTNAAIKTQSYLLAEIKTPAQSYSIKLPDSGAVLAITAELSPLSTLLQNRDLGKATEIYFYPQTGGVIASNQPEKSTALLPAAPRLELSNEQLAIIQNDPVLSVTSEIDWPPLNYSNNGVPSGYAVDVLAYISRMTGLEMQFISGESWQELATQFVDGELEIMQPVFYSEFRNFMGEMTIPFVEVPYGIITTSQTPITHISELNNKTVAIPEGWSLIGRLQADFPDINIIETETTRGIFEAVISGKADAGMDTAITLQYITAQEYADEIMVHQGVDFAPAELPAGLHFMVNRQRTGLAEIFNSALENLSDTHHQALVDKWFNSIDREGNPQAFSFDRFRSDALQVSDELQSITLNGQDYYVYHRAIEMNDAESQFLTIISPQNTVMSMVWSKSKNAALVAALMLLLLLPFSWWFASILVSRLKKIQLDIDHVQQRHFAAINSQSSHLLEFNALSDKLRDMSLATQFYQKSHQQWTDSLVESVAHAIDAKSAYPTRHCELVPELTMLLADKASESNESAFKDFQLDNDVQQRELRLAAWLHSYGKITTPEYLVDKRTKLEMPYNRIHEIRMRFEVLWRDAEIEFWQQTMQRPEKRTVYEDALKVKQIQLEDDFAFVAQCNIGTEFMDQNTNERLKRLSKISWQRHFDDQLGLSPVELARYHDSNTRLPATEQLLDDKPEHIIPHNQKAAEDAKSGVNLNQPEYGFNHGELYNLTIESGTLTKEERFRINEHILTTIKMLESLPYPDELSNIPRYATTHLETMNGTGYPRGLTAENLSVPERIIMLANVFEALTAAERPYKKAKTLSVAIFILHQLVEQQLMDRDVFELFLTSGAYKQYAERFMAAEQIDEVDISRFISDADRYI